MLNRKFHFCVYIYVYTHIYMYILIVYTPALLKYVFILFTDIFYNSLNISLVILID